METREEYRLNSKIVRLKLQNGKHRKHNSFRLNSKIVRLKRLDGQF